MKEDLSRVIESAIAGNRDSMDELLQRVQPRLRAYILRSTLNEDLTEDIVQETMLQLLSSLKTLTDPSRFWPWLFTIANNKKISHFRAAKRHPATHFSALQEHLLESAMEEDTADIHEKPAMKELHRIVLATMEKLTHDERSVLSLRCFEDMPYREIAEVTGCSQSTIRVQFLRARNKLHKSLTAQGLSHKAVLPALILFGKMTADEALAGTVTASSVSLGTGMTTVQTLIATVKAGLAQYAAITATAAAVAFGTHVAWARTHPHPYPQRDKVLSVHYTVQGIGELDEKDKEEVVRPNNRSRKGDVDEGPYYCKGAFEQYLQFPEGPDGPVLVRMQRWGLDPKTHQNTSKLCGWLQNGRGNYYYAKGLNRIYITNDPIGMLILPTDPPEMVDFLLAHCNCLDRVQYERDRKTGLLTSKNDHRVPTVGNYQTDYAYNSLTEADFDAFWPTTVDVIDDRDAMHYRGWTYVRIDGKLGDQTIRGTAMVPLNYRTWQARKPWLEVTVGQTLRIIDTPDGAALTDLASGQSTAFAAGTFFTGLGRPWIGIRVFDTLRRDAARQRIPFKAKCVDEAAAVHLTRQLGPDTYEINYTLDMLTDTITQIDLANGQTSGHLTLTYAQDDIDVWAADCHEPTLPDTGKQTLQTRYWLMDLLRQTAGEQPEMLAAQ